MPASNSSGPSKSAPSHHIETKPSARVNLIRQRVRVPWRLIESAHYSDATLAVYIKVKALGQRPEGCTAGAARIAEYLGMSLSSVERGLTQLRRPAPDGVVELTDVRRRTLRGGRGTTAWREVRAMSSRETFVWIPVLAAELLSPRELRAYAIIRYAVVRNMPLTEGQLAELLRHHRGKNAGQPITVWAASQIIDGLEQRGWVEIGRRNGAHGRHRFAVRDVPQESQLGQASGDADGAAEAVESAPVGASDAVPSLSVGDGSGASVGDGSHAYEESPTTCRPENGGAARSPAVGEVTVGGPTLPAGDVCDGQSLALRADGQHSPASAQTARGGEGPRAYSGPALTLSPRVWSVLEPVKVLMPRLNAFVQRKVAREIGRQLDAGTSVPRLRHRLEQRLAVTGLADVRDPGRWLLGVALPWWSHCGHQACEAGVIWDSQTACHTCDEILEDRRVARERERRISAGLCPDHVTPPARDGSCVDCEIEQMLSVPQSLTPPRFPVRLCAGCDRPFQTSADAGELCLTCRSGVANSSVEVQTSPSPGSCCSGCGLHTTRALPGGRCLGCAQRALLSVGGGTLSA